MSYSIWYDWLGTWPANSGDYIIEVDVGQRLALGHVVLIRCTLTDAPSYETGA